MGARLIVMAQREEVLKNLLLRLENIQRDIGEVQKEIISLFGQKSASLPIFSGNPTTVGGAEELDDQSDPAAQHLRPAPPPCVNPVDWLGDRGIKLLRAAPADGLDETLDRLALFLGQRFPNIRPFYEALKRRVGGHPRSRALNLRDAPPRMISDICQFARDLHNNGFLTRVQYFKDTRKLFFDPQRDGRVVNFFTGDWLERYVLLTALGRAEALLLEGVKPMALTKAVVTLQDDQETELDILLGLPDRVIWIECKTGDWQEHAVKFGKVARQLAIPPDQAALVLLDSMTPEQKRNASVLSRMTVISPEEVGNFVENALKPETFGQFFFSQSATDCPLATDKSISISQAPAPPAVAVSPSDPGAANRYIAWLAKRGLRPLDTHLRRQIVCDLAQLNRKERIPLSELQKRLKIQYEATSIQVSKTQISDVGNALRKAGMCLRGSHPAYPSGTWFLRADVLAAEMLEQCALLYVWTLLKNPDWPDDSHLDKQTVGEIVLWDFDSKRDNAASIEQLLETLGAMGKCQKNGAGWIATGETFVDE
jgi:hypothetical protein